MVSRDKIAYLGIHRPIVSSSLFKCSLTMTKRSFYRAANAIHVFGKIGGRATEDVILQLIRSKCLPALLYGLELACPLRKVFTGFCCQPSVYETI